MIVRVSSDGGDESMDEEKIDENREENAENEEDVGTKKVYLPGKKMETDEELVIDESAYRILHQAQTGPPCLSFHIIKDDLGNSREVYPMIMYLLAGTQAPRTHVHNLLVMKMSNLHGTKVKEDSDEDSSDSEDEDNAKTPVMNVASIKHQGCINRVRCTQIVNTTLAASWTELGRVTLWNLNEQLKAVENPGLLLAYCKKCEKSDVKPIFSFKGHLSDGYTEADTLTSGDCKVSKFGIPEQVHGFRCSFC